MYIAYVLILTNHPITPSAILGGTTYKCDGDFLALPIGVVIDKMRALFAHESRPWNGLWSESLATKRTSPSAMYKRAWEKAQDYLFLFLSFLGRLFNWLNMNKRKTNETNEIERFLCH